MTRYTSVARTRAEGVALAKLAAEAVAGTLVDVDQDGDRDLDDIVLEGGTPVRELQRIPCWYELGAGGGDADRIYPWNERNQCDCSAAVGHWIGKPRGDGDWGTTKILSDAYKMEYAPGDAPAPMVNTGPGPQTRFRPVSKDEPVLPGDILIIAGVYGRKLIDGKMRRYRKAPGHIELVVDLDDDFDRSQFSKRSYRDVQIIGCSPRKSQLFGPGHAIAQTNAEFARTRGYFLRFKGWVGE